MASVRLESGQRTGWLYHYHSTTEILDDGGEDIQAQGVNKAALILYMQDHAGDHFHVNLHYDPYILVMAVDGHEREVELGLVSMFGPQLIRQISMIEKEDLDLVNHLSGRKRTYLKVTFHNVQDLTAVRTRLDKIVKRNQEMTGDNPLWGQFGGSLSDAMAKNFEDDPFYSAGGTTRWMDWVQDMREYDVKYHMRVAIDLKIYCGLWYDVAVEDGETRVVRCDDSRYAPAMPRVCAFDIETTKAPLRFPQPEVDQIYMISYMLDGRGYLIVNREIVTEDINAFEYTPKPEYEGFFDTFNEADEAATLRRFFDEMQKYRPNVYVTYNGDYFDFPFIHARALFHGMNMRREIGFSQGAEGAFLNPQIPHLDCFYWVKRDSYLPQGSQGLKAVTRYKLGYDPIEVDPEDMLPLAQNEPQRMASYSVSDAVSTWYLYQKYVHPFIFSLATIIPMSADDVLRKGSGGLCESLLMVQAEAGNVVFPNKREMVREKFYDGHLIDSETYIGGRVEALRSGVYRSDLPIRFNINPDTMQDLIDDVESAMRFTLEVENNVKVEDVTNFAEVVAKVREQLGHLRDNPHLEETPMIYHLDVGAMYPNIILTNRLQPYAIPSADVCAGCCFNSPTNDLQCKRSMSWKWRGELFTAGRYEYQRVKAQLENESFAAAVVHQADLAAVQKKAYGNRKGNVLEGTAYEQKDDWKKKGGSGGGGGGRNQGYRQETRKQQKEASDALLHKEFGLGSDGDGSDDEDGVKAYHNLSENTQFNMLKKRLSEYSRKAYGKVHESREIMRTNVVCQRENSFYVDTVRLFRDRRYEYKAALKKWKKNLDNAKDADEIKLCQSRCVQMESLQLAHKCILNSFYGYVMRKGSRWSSMEMAGIVTYLGATLIQMARALVQHIGVTLELDTDGIWCCLPHSFPENFTFETTNPSKPKVGISYPAVVLNKMVNDRYSNPQYQNLTSPGVYQTHNECSIYFEVDGPYLAMLLPASREEGKSIKKRYAVFNPDGKLAELKGFELKRRGELMLIKDFQSQVFRRFLDGGSLQEAYASAASVANVALDMLESKGEGYEMEEILDKITESSNMTRRLSEYPEAQKSLAITTARRIAECLGPQMVKDKGLACHYVISRLPAGRPVTERAIPTTIFRTDPAVRLHFLRKWTGDVFQSNEINLQQLLDWEYYTARFSACVQKIITIPAALQNIANPVPRVKHPDWLHKKVLQQSSRFRQVSLMGLLEKKRGEPASGAIEGHGPTPDMEDLIVLGDSQAPDASKSKSGAPKGTTKKEGRDEDSDWENEEEDVIHVQSEEDDDERAKRELDEEEAALAQDVQRAYFTAKNLRSLDATFFNARGTAKWLQDQKQSWIHRARLRKQLGMANNGGASGADWDGTANGDLLDGGGSGLPGGGGALDAHLIDVKSKALSCTWHVLEVREVPEDPGIVHVLAALDKTLYTLRVQVPRRVLVDTDPSARIAFLDGEAQSVSGRVLPRHREPGSLFQITVQPGTEGERRLNELSITEGVRGLHETFITREQRLVEMAGCCMMIDTRKHLQNAKTQGRAAQRELLFALDELDMTTPSNYLLGAGDRTVFIFHAASENRGTIAVVNQHDKTATVVFVQAAAAARPTVNWSALSTEAAQALDTSPTALSVTVEVATDQAAAWRVVSQVLTDMLNNGSRGPLLAVLQSSVSTRQLLQQRSLPPQLPYLRTLGGSEDEKLLSDPFRWAQLLSRRLLQRYYASILWVQERLAMSRLAGIPVCNIEQDSCVHVLDVLYARALHRRSHVLWCSSDPAVAFDRVEERPRQVVMPGGYTSWSVEFSLSRLDVVSILFSQMIQEADDPNAQILCDRGVSSHFNILRDLVADMLGQAVNNSVADTLLSNVARWLRDPVSNCYEPRLVEMLSGLAHRALTAVLMRLAKLGGRTVMVSESAVVVLTPKYSLQEAISFANFVTTSVQDQPMMILLSLQPTRYWGPFVVLDRRDFAGLFVDAERAIKSATSDAAAMNPLQCLQPEQFFTLVGRLPPPLHAVFRKRVTAVLTQVAQIVNVVRLEAAKDASVTLATHGDDVLKRLAHRLQALMEHDVQEEVIEEVQRIADGRLTAGAAPEGKAPLWSSNNAALEYAKCLCKVLELIPSQGAVGKIRNNCMRLCGISPFAQDAQLSTDPLSTWRALAVTCSFCNVVTYLDLTVKRKTGSDYYRCGACHAPIAAASVEARLVRSVNQIVTNYNQQDFVCSKCKEMSPNYLAQTCCAPLKGKEKSIHASLAAMKLIAEVQAFDWLNECVGMASLCS